MVPISQRNESPFLFFRVGHDYIGRVLLKLQHISCSEVCFQTVLFLAHHMCEQASSLLGVITLKQYGCGLKKRLMGRMEIYVGLGGDISVLSPSSKGVRSVAQAEVNDFWVGLGLWLNVVSYHSSLSGIFHFLGEPYLWNDNFAEHH